MIRRLLTKNFTEVPLILISFDYQKFKKFGKKNSCTIHIHPSIKSDDFLKEKVGEIIDYIRDNYDMKKLL
jgi:hypothetical protein